VEVEPGKRGSQVGLERLRLGSQASSAQLIEQAAGNNRQASNLAHLRHQPQPQAKSRLAFGRIACQYPGAAGLEVELRGARDGTACSLVAQLTEEQRRLGILAFGHQAMRLLKAQEGRLAGG
jgi:hypothetical protein